MSKKDGLMPVQTGDKLTYAAPRLTCFGEVKNLTAAGTAMGIEQPPGQGGGIDQMIMAPN